MITSARGGGNHSISLIVAQGGAQVQMRIRPSDVKSDGLDILLRGVLYSGVPYSSSSGSEAVTSKVPMYSPLSTSMM